MAARIAMCPRCGREAAGGPWGGDHCRDRSCLVEEWNATPAHLRRGNANLTMGGPGWFAVTVWAYLPSGRQFVVKQDRRGRLAGPERERYVNDAIGYRAQSSEEAFS